MFAESDLRQMNELFEQYTAAWDKFDPHAIAALYELPCCIVDGDGVQTYADRAELNVKLAKNCVDMRKLGYEKAYFTIIEQTPLDSGQYSVNIAWRIETQGQPITFRTLYICHLINGCWRINSAHVYQGAFPDAIVGLNHITIAVSEVQRSLEFYTHVLGFNGIVQWDGGAYLSCNNVWLCLSLDEPSPANDYSHIAWSVEADDFATLKHKILNAGAREWKHNKSEGDSLYFCDPDGHKLEVHAGSLQSRLESLTKAPYQGLKWL